MKKSGIKQHDIRDCGAACLATIFQYYGLNVPLVKVREKMKVDKNGSSLYSISVCAQEYNFDTEVLEGTYSELIEEIEKNNVALPIIVHCREEDFGHFIVLEKIKRNIIKVFDPAKGYCDITIDEFKEKWTGYLITLKKGSNFKECDEGKNFNLKYWKIFIKNKRILFWTLLISLFLGGITMLCSLSYQRIIDDFILKNGTNALNYVGENDFIEIVVQQINSIISNFHLFFLALIIMLVIQMFASIAKGVFVAMISAKVNKELIDDYMRAIVHLPVSYFKDRETGEILSRFSNIEEIRGLISEGGIAIIMNILMATVGGIILAQINLVMFIIVIGILGIYFIIIFLLKRPIADIKLNIFESNSRLISRLKETIDNITTIKSCCAEGKILRKLNCLSEKTLLHVYKGEIISESQSALLGNIESIGTICILWLGSVLVMENKISLGDLIVFGSLLRFFLAPFQQLITMQIELQGAFIAMDRLNDILEVNTEEIIHTGKKEPSIIGKNISYNDVTFGYNLDTTILQNVSVCFESGKHYALIGKSGCGKSTLMKLLVAHYVYENGKISIGDDDIKDISLKYLRKKIKYISADSRLFEGSIIDNMMIECSKEKNDPTVKDIIEGCGVLDVLMALPQGLNSKISEGGIELSNGQRQRIVLARTLLAEPEVLILDEATSHLDTDSEKRIFHFIMEYMTNVTCISVLHNMELASMCDEIIYIDHGNIINKSLS